MTFEELELQVQKNTTAINDLDAALDSYATTAQLTNINNSIASNNSAIQALQQAVSALQTSIGLINKISKLLDVNIGTDLAKNDILQFDGDRWTNISPSELGITGTSSAITRLEDLRDVSITSKSHGQALTWNSTTSRWTNTTIQTSTPGTGFDEQAMWEALSGDSSRHKIKPEYINGQSLSLSGIVVNGNTIQFSNGNNTVSVNSGNLSVSQAINATGNIQSDGEITAYA